MSQAQCLHHDSLGDLLCAGLDHDDGVPGAGDHEVELGLVLHLSEGGVDHELVLDAPHAHGPDRAEEGDLAETQGRRGAQSGEHVVVVLEVDGQHGGHHVDLVHISLGEQRPDGPVDLARGEGGLVAGPRLALDEAAGDLAGGVVPLLDVDREGEEILPLASYGAPCGADEHHRVAAAHEYCSAGLLGQTAGLEGDLLAPDLYFYCSHLFLRLPNDPAPHCAQVLSRP